MQPLHSLDFVVCRMATTSVYLDDRAEPAEVRLTAGVQLTERAAANGLQAGGRRRRTRSLQGVKQGNASAELQTEGLLQRLAAAEATIAELIQANNQREAAYAQPPSRNLPEASHPKASNATMNAYSFAMHEMLWPQSLLAIGQSLVMMIAVLGAQSLSDHQWNTRTLEQMWTDIGFALCAQRPRLWLLRRRTAFNHLGHVPAV